MVYLILSNITFESLGSCQSFNSIPANTAGETLDYRRFRTTKYISLWLEFLSNLKVRQGDALLAQYISGNT